MLHNTGMQPAIMIGQCNPVLAAKVKPHMPAIGTFALFPGRTIVWMVIVGDIVA